MERKFLIMLIIILSFVNLCQKDSYVIGGDNMQSETFLDEILKEGFEGSEPVHIIMEKEQMK